MTNFSGNLFPSKTVNVACDDPKGGGVDSRRNALEQAAPEGYKQTEVGVIPLEWQVLKVDDFSLKVGSGKTPTGGSSVYVGSGRPFVRSQNVGSGNLRLSDLAYITEETHSTFIGSEIKTDDVLLNITGASIGRCALTSSIISGGNVNQHVCIIRPNSAKVTPYLLQTLINSDAGQQQIDSYQAGGNREGLNFSQVRNMQFAFSHDIKEQAAIASALSDVDALLTELEKLIAKKQAIKTATMQQLLTGKTRLPQFAFYSNESAEDATYTEGADEGNSQGQPKHSSGTTVNGGACDAGSRSPNVGGGMESRRKGTKPSELGEIPEDWDVVSLGDIGNTVIGLTYSPNDVAEYGTLVLRSSNVQKNTLAYENNVFVDMDLPERVIVKEGDILVCVRNGSRNLIGKCALIDKNAEGSAFGAFMSIYRTKQSKFIFFQFQSNVIQNQINEIMGATINQITNKDMAAFKVTLPSDEKEQTAIATILSDMDSEIQTLEQRLAKTRQIKQGMMQALLTGRTRLPY